MAAEDLGATEGQVGLAGGSIRAHHFLPAKQYCTNLSPIESILQYRFATPKPLKARPGPEGMQNRSFAQPFLVACGCFLPVDLSTEPAAPPTCSYYLFLLLVCVFGLVEEFGLNVFGLVEESSISCVRFGRGKLH